MTDSDPHWYKDAIIYQLHVRAFQDASGDGIGDFRGLRQRLDYIQDLGVTAIWLQPFYPSPLKDDGYDIADYSTVHPSYGTLTDFREFLDAAHRRGLRVITELVHQPHIGPASVVSASPRRSLPGSIERDFYVWSDTSDKYADARIIFKDFERSNWTWDPVGECVLLASVLLASAGLELRQPGRARSASHQCSTSGWRWAWTGCVWTRSRTCTSVKERTARTCRRRTHI